MTEVEKNLRVSHCLKCMHSKCGNSFINKCNKDGLVCGINNMNISNALNTGGNCPYGYWNIFNRKKNCGCGK